MLTSSPVGQVQPLRYDNCNHKLHAVCEGTVVTSEATAAVCN